MASTVAKYLWMGTYLPSTSRTHWSSEGQPTGSRSAWTIGKTDMAMNIISILTKTDFSIKIRKVHIPHRYRKTSLPPDSAREDQDKPSFLLYIMPGTSIWPFYKEQKYSSEKIIYQKFQRINSKAIIKFPNFYILWQVLWRVSHHPQPWFKCVANIYEILVIHLS